MIGDDILRRRKAEITTRFRVPVYTVAQAAALTNKQAGELAYISNETGGTVLAFCDGTDWRRVTDRVVIS